MPSGAGTRETEDDHLLAFSEEPSEVRALVDQLGASQQFSRYSSPHDLPIELHLKGPAPIGLESSAA